MKISLSDELANELSYLRSLAGYESTQAVIRILVRLYKDDFATRFNPGLNSSQPQIIAQQVALPLIQSQAATPAIAPTPNPTPEW